MTAMAIEAKICGINSLEAARAAAEAGAGYLGFVFYPPSPRSLSPDAAAAIAREVDPGPQTVALCVDLDDGALSAILDAYPFDLLQLHGSEDPARVAEVRSRFGRRVMKAIKVAEAADLDAAADYEAVADRLLFDAKPPKAMAGALPGGNAISFDWTLLAGRTWAKPWMLSGGLDEGNVGEAVRISGASAVDVSSGVEDRPGVKNPRKIRRFLAVVDRL